jgi:CubicO group peptidase (beta-lactamase class C family)
MNPCLPLCLFLLLSAAAAQAQVHPGHPKLDSLRAVVQGRVARGEAASVALVVARGGQVLWEEAFGWADRERRVPATPQTVYPVASLSKAITATGVWLLAEQGRLRLDAPVHRYLRSARLAHHRGHPDDLRVGHLLNMAGGIPHQLTYHYDADRQRMPTVAWQIGHHGLVVFPPGKHHVYSNFSFAVADQLITDVAGVPYPEVLRDRLFKPLGMNTASAHRPANVARGYFADGKPVEVNHFLPRGGAGLYASTRDLLRFGQMHLGLASARLLSPAALTRMHAQPEGLSYPYYANGWGRLPLRTGSLLLLANGAIAGAASTLLVLPKENLVVVCLTNSTLGNDFTDALGFEIAFALAPNLKPAFEALVAEVGAQLAPRPFVPTADWLGPWSGHLRVGKRALSVRLVVKADSTAWVSVNGQPAQAVRELAWEHDLLNGRWTGTLPLPELARQPHELHLQLVREGNRLYGVFQAASTGAKPGFLWPYAVALTREP